MSIFKCKMCGGTIEFEQGATVGVCDSCGTKQTLPSVSDEVVTNLHNRANTLRLKCEFDKAEEIYNKILVNDPNDAEAHWGIILCKYGIEYVEDPKTYKRVPTCHRTSFDAILADEDYKAALADGDFAQRELYEAEAREIDRIQKDILSIVKNEKPFDVFICYKETDENGKRTQDSVIANDIYYQLTQEGFNVFYAAITLEDKLGTEYEPYIFAALNSAKVMLVVGSKPEYFTAVWVKNEWSRFLKLMKTDKKKLLIPCYKDMDAYELPEEFAHLQAQDMGKIGFINDLVRGIKKVADAASLKDVVKETVVVNGGNTNVAPLLKRAFMFLEDGEWDKADNICEQVLNQDPENAEGYLGKLMAELRVRKQNDLKDCEKPFDGSSNYQKAIRFSDETLADTLKEYIAHINERNETSLKQGIYDKATSAESAGTEQSLKNAAALFGQIKGFKDADELAEQCLIKAEVCRKDAVYSKAMQQLGYGTEFSVTDALRRFESVRGWKAADENAEKCRQIIAAREEKSRLEAENAKKRKKVLIIVILAIVAAIALCFGIGQLYDRVIRPMNEFSKANTLMKNGQYEDAIRVFEALDGYRDSDSRINNCREAMRGQQYDEAVALLESEQYEDALEAFTLIDGYKDSKEKIAEIYQSSPVSQISSAAVGDHVFFGTFEQDNDLSNGSENIEWIVLENNNGVVKLLSAYVLDWMPLNNYENGWRLMDYLNGEFFDDSFSDIEKFSLKDTLIRIWLSPETTEFFKVYMPCYQGDSEYNDTIPDQFMQGIPTAIARAKGAPSGVCPWWLFTMGVRQSPDFCVDETGSVANCHDSVYEKYNGFAGVRPVITVDSNRKTQPMSETEAYKTLLSGMEYGEFAIIDLNSDGKQELVLRSESYYQTGNTFTVFDFDAEDNSCRQLCSGTAAHFYDNGVIIFFGWQGSGNSNSIYSIYQYDKTAYQYKYEGYITAINMDSQYKDGAVFDLFQWRTQYYNTTESSGIRLGFNIDCESLGFEYSTEYVYNADGLTNFMNILIGNANEIIPEWQTQY